jgi:subtilisin family serine protease
MIHSWPFFRSITVFVLSVTLLMVSSMSGNVGANDDLYYYTDAGVRTRLQTVSDANGVLSVRPAGIGEGAPLTVSRQFVVRVDDPNAIQALAQEWNATVTGSLAFDNRLIVLEASDARAALQIANAALERGQVSQVFTQFERPLYARELPNDPSFGSQWHLNNTGQGGGSAGHDVNVNPVWNFTGNSGLGAGVTIGVVDSRVQSNHADLVGNIRTDRSLWLSGTAGSHGTSVAGVVAGVGNNSIGISGVAPRGSIAGISLLNQSGTDANEATALSHHFDTMNGSQFDGIHIYNNSWGPADNATRDAPGPLVRAALQNATQSGRGGLGNIYVWAGGNGGNSANGYLGDNVNYDGYANSRYVIAVGSTANHSLRSSYSERGAALLVNAPSNGGSLGITTTTSGGGYTSTFGGTSSASPAAAGVVALILEANPNLGWRDVKHILVNTSRRTDTGNSSWGQNGAGKFHSDLYGFGTVDAAAAVAAATSWVNVAPEISTTQSASFSAAIADGTGSLTTPVYGNAFTSSFNVTENLRVEHVEVGFSASGGREGDLEILLTSPFGTQSVLAYPHGDSNDYVNWTFMTVKNWGESSLGTWTLRVRDGVAGSSSVWTGWSLSVYGTAFAIPEPGMAGLLWLAGMVLLRRRTRCCQVSND